MSVSAEDILWRRGGHDQRADTTIISVARGSDGRGRKKKKSYKAGKRVVETASRRIETR